MSESAICDVYFWSDQTGLIEFRGVEFRARPRRQWASAGTVADPLREAPSFSEAEPFVRYTAEDPPFAAAAAVGEIGLLWTTDAEPRKPFPHMIPARLRHVESVPRTTDDGRTVRDVVVRWQSIGPFVAEGFSMPKVIAVEPAPA